MISICYFIFLFLVSFRSIRLFVIRHRSLLLSTVSIGLILIIAWPSTDSRHNSKQTKKKVLYNLMEETKGMPKHVKDCTIGESTSCELVGMQQQLLMIKLSWKNTQTRINFSKIILVYSILFVASILTNRHHRMCLCFWITPMWKIHLQVKWRQFYDY